jgi:hypothetical protein
LILFLTFELIYVDWIAYATAVAAEATVTATSTKCGTKTPIIPMEVKIAKAPPAGVKAPYIHD